MSTYMNGMKFQDDNLVVMDSNEAIARPLETRLIRFDNAADMPADITSLANVTADTVVLTGFAATARRVEFHWHGHSVGIALGARIVVNALHSADAYDRLTYTDLTGGGSSSSGKADTVLVSPSSPVAAFAIDINGGDSLDNVYLIGIPSGSGTVACYLEVRAYG